MFKHLKNETPTKILKNNTNVTVRVLTNRNLNRIYEEGKVGGLILKKSTFEKYIKLTGEIILEIANGEHNGSMITGIIPSMDCIKSSGIVDNQNRKMKYIKFEKAELKRYKYMVVKHNALDGPPKEDKNSRKSIMWKINY
jgi:hypothetical protein